MANGLADTQPLETLLGTTVRPKHGTLYLVQELAAGRDMFWLWWESPGRRLSEERARFFILQLLDALLYHPSMAVAQSAVGLPGEKARDV
jgi:serine/threonine protein kinase